MNKNLSTAQLAFDLALADGLIVSVKVWDCKKRKFRYDEQFSDALDIVNLPTICQLFNADVWEISYSEHECEITLIADGLAMAHHVS